MITVCPYCKKEIQWCWERSVYYQGADEGEEERGEIQCPDCDGFIAVD